MTRSDTAPPSGRDPHLRGRLVLRREGRAASYHAPHSLFSSHGIDRGTLLLLDHLPTGTPRSFLDLGSGYGVLGLETAARFPEARGLLVDRDLLAVEWSRRNAELHGAKVEVLPSLGYRDIPPDRAPFDWILSNVPARAGERVLESFILGGLARLAPGGEMRIVCIAPLAESLERIAAARGIERLRPALDRRHAIYAFPRRDAPPPGPDPEGEEVHERDAIALHLPEPLRLVRPSDLADEPHRLAESIPLLAARMPREGAGKVLVFRAGYGLLPALVLARYPEARVVAQDRDLLATAFTRRNCAAESGRLEIVESIDLAAAAPHGPFDLVIGELSPPLGPRAALHELAEARALLAAGGRALIASPKRLWRETVAPAAKGMGIAEAVSGNAVVVMEITRASSTR